MIKTCQTLPGLAATAILLLAACTQDTVPNDELFKDSAGIWIATHDEVYSAGSEWHLDPEPVRTIGVASGSKPYEFSRIINVLNHPLGFVVADGTSGELRLFDETGKHLKSVGGIGSGPGEFQLLRWAGTWADSVYTWDLRLRRLTVFDLDLQFIRTEALALPMPYAVLGLLSGTHVVVWPFGSTTAPVSAPVVRRDSSFFAVVDMAASSSVDTIVRVPSQATYLEPEDVLIRVPFSGEVVYAVGRSSVWVGNADIGEITRVDVDGLPQTILRLPPGRPISAEYRSAFVSDELAHYADEERAAMARTYDRVPFPEMFPAFSAMVVEDGGNLWLREYLAPRTKVARWTIISDRGAVEAHIDLPSQLTVLRVTPDEITGVWRDELNVESVRIFTYTRESQG